MNEKRFQYNVNKNIIEQNGKFVAYMNCVDGGRIANKLNEFQKENEHLKKENNKLQDEYDLWIYSSSSCEYDSLKEENEQLRKENKKLNCIIKQLEVKYEDKGFSLAYDMGECE